MLDNRSLFLGFLLGTWIEKGVDDMVIKYALTRFCKISNMTFPNDEEWKQIRDISKHVSDSLEGKILY